jgi:hypothetical protein
MEKIKTTLIIHPDDRSTDFLRPIYANIENKTVITGNVTKQQLTDLIQHHDTIMMMGHGSPHGLFAVGNFIDCHGYIISMNDVELLKQKTDNVYVWCNANVYFNKYELKGFSTSMFISEVGEAYYCGLPNVNQNEVNESNDYFAYLLGKLLPTNSLQDIYNLLIEEYKILAESNSVAEYNVNGLCFR